MRWRALLIAVVVLAFGFLIYRPKRLRIVAWTSVVQSQCRAKYAQARTYSESLLVDSFRLPNPTGSDSLPCAALLGR